MQYSKRRQKMNEGASTSERKVEKKQSLIRSKALQEPVTPDHVEMLNIPDVAQRLKVSRNQVYQLIKKKGLPSCLIGDVLRVPLVKLHRWIEQQEQSHVS